VKCICRQLPLLAVLLLSASFASAQSTVDFGIGFGSNTAKSSNQLIDTFGDGTLYRTPKLGGFFMGFGGNAMLWPKLGFGAAYTFQPHKPDYAGIKARTGFYDFNAIYQPVSTPRFVPQLIGGIGGANMRFYLDSQFCNPFSGCSSQSQFFDSSNHFQVHGGAAVQIFLTERIFIRPQFDARYVRNFTQFGTNFVPGGTIWLGYSMGDR
jgi:hypothetical protein